MGHRGPLQVYLSRAPNDDLESYQGDGDFFKIAYSGPVSDSEWETYHGDGVRSILFFLNYSILS